MCVFIKECNKSIIKKSILLLFIIFSSSVTLLAQETIDINPYIKAWKTKGVKQTIEFEKSLVHFTNLGYDDFLYSEKHEEIINKTNKYLKNNPDKRVEVRALIYDVLVRRFKMDNGDTIRKKLLHAMKISNTLKDKQLLSEVYMLYARFNRKKPEYIIYTIKALKIQENIGIQYFPRYHNGLFDLCFAMYHLNDYDRSLYYGNQFLKTFKNKSSKVIDIYAYFYIIDLMGANYFRQEKLDKALEYHQKLYDTLRSGKAMKGRVREIWKGVSQGNLGQIYYRQNKIQQSIPLLNEALQTSLEYEIWNTAAGTLNTLGKIDFDNLEYKSALNKWKQAYDYASHRRMAMNEPLMKLQYELSKNISDAFLKLSQIDSAYVYLKRYQDELQEFQNELNTKNFALITANLNFEEAQNNLQLTEQKLTTEKTIRNASIIAILLLSIISLLIINQKRLAHKLLVRKNQEAQKRIEQAKQNIETFKKHLSEKEELIETFQKYSSTSTDEMQQKLLQYVLLTDDDWLKFKSDFISAYPTFFTALKKVLETTPAEERLSCLMYLKLNNTQISNMLGISSDSVARAKRRLKSKLSLPETISLEEFIYKL